MALNQYGAGFVMTAEDQATPVFARIKKSLRGLGGAAANQNTQMQAMGRAMLGFAATRIIAPFRTAMEESRAFGKAIAEVGTLVDSAVFPTSKMQEITEELAATYGKDAKEQAKGLYQTISAGTTDAAKATELMHTANKLAAGGVTEVAVAVDGLTTLVNAYSADAVSATSASDAMFVAIKAGKTTAEELSHSVGRVAPTAAAAKIGMDELLGSLAAITTQGIGTSEAASGLKAAIANILKPTAEAKKEAQRLGIQFSAATLRSKGLKGMLDMVTGSAKYNEDSITKLFGSIEALNTVQALTANGGAKLNEIMDGMAHKAGATDAAFEKMRNTMDFQLGRFKELRANIARSFGESLERILAPVVKILVRITEAVDRFFRSLPPGAKDVIVGIVGALGALVALAGGLMLVNAALNMMGFGFFDIIKSVATFVLVGAPAILMLAGMGTAVYALYRAFRKNTGGISDAWYTSMAKIKLAWRGVMELFTDGELSKSMRKELGKAGNEGVTGFLNTVQRMIGRLKVFWAGIKRGFEEGVDALAESSAFKALRETFRGLFEMFTGEGAENSEEMLQRWGEAGASAGRKLASLGERAIEVINWLIEAGGKVREALQDITADDISTGIERAIDLFNGLYETISAIASVVRTVVNVITFLLRALMGIGEAVGGTMTRAVQVLFETDPKKRDAASKRMADYTRSLFQSDVENPFSGAREDAGDIARAWGSDTRFGFEVGDRAKAEGKRENMVSEIQDEIRSMTAAKVSGIEREVRGLIARREANEVYAGKLASEGKADEGLRVVAGIEQLNKQIGAMLKQRQDLKVYLDADDMNAKLAGASRADASRDLDQIEVAGVV